MLLDLSIDEMVGAWCFGCCQSHRGLPVGFFLLRYSVFCTVESLSLLYLLFISWFICFWRWCIDKLGSLSYKSNIYVSWSTSELRVRLAPWNRCKPSSKIFLLTVPRWYFFCGSFLSCVSHAFMSVHCCFVVTCWKRADLLLVVSLLLSHVVFWVRCGTWLYCFLIFAIFLI